MPDSSKKLQADQTPFVTMWLETSLGTRYEFPDMLEHHVTEAHRNLDTAELSQSVHIRNVSEALLMLPKRIITRAGVGSRCFWERL
jgi:hypothetical protein